MKNYRKALVPVIAAILIFSFIPNSIFADSEDEFDHPYVSGQVIVSFKPGVSQEDIEDFYEDFYEDYDLTEEENFDNDESDDDPEEKLVSTLVDVDSEIIRIIRQDQRVEFAELNYILTTDIIPNDPQFNQLWGLDNTGQLGGTIDADIDAPETWDITTNSSNIIVGIIDTGVDYNHPDLDDNIWENPGETGLDGNGTDKQTNGIDDDSNGFIDDVHGINAITGSGDPMDDHSHGTHVAGTIGAKGNNGIGVAGVNWDVSIAGCKFLNSAGSGSTADAIKCFNYFNDLKSSGQNVLITSNSWGGGGFSQTLKDAMTGLNHPTMSPILHVSAAGNDGDNTDISPHYPASYDLDNIISVAYTDRNDNYSPFSNYGPTTVDLAAPGVDILSTVLANGYGLKSGTSMATPHVSGTAALIWSTFPDSTYSEIKSRIMAGADPLSDLSKTTQTNSRLNVFNALENDIIPPSAATDLLVSGEDLTQITLSWTASGDDGLVGTASFYDVRYSTLPITDLTWNAAIQAVGEPTPQDPGLLETFTVSGLSQGASYNFALKVIDNAGNESGLSNVVVGTTAANVIRFEDNMEGGIGGWTTEGTPGPPIGVDGGLWHLSTHNSNSPTTSWYYGIEQVFNYDTTGSPNQGTLTSPAISLAGSTSAFLIFNEWSQIEPTPTADLTRVMASVDGVTWIQVFESHGTGNAWSQRTVDLSSFVGGDVFVRFWFDTVDHRFNTFEGWYIDDVQVIVDQNPIPPNQPPVANAGLDQSGNEGDSFTFDGAASTDPDGTILSYDWDFGDGDVGSGISPIHVYSDNAIYTTTLTVTDNSGGTSADTSLVSVSNVAPTANVGGPYSGLTGSPITFSASATDPGSDVLTYEWDFDYDGIIFTADSFGVNLTNPSHIYTLEGIRTVGLQVNDDDGGTSPISSTQVTVTQPNPPIVDLASSSSSNGGTQFSWTHNTGTNSNRLLVVGTSVGDNPAEVSSITYGSQSLVPLRSDKNTNADTATELWYLINPSSGANIIEITMTDKKSVIAGAITFSGVDQTTPFSSNAGAIGAGVTPGVTISSDPNDVVVDVMALFKGSGTSSPGLDQIQRWNLLAKDVEGGSSTKAGSASVIMSWTTDNTDWATSAASINGATLGPPPPPNTSPVLSLPILPTNIDELVLFTFQATGVDSDVPAQPLTFGLSGEPAGAIINQSTGVFTWIPTEAQGGDITLSFDVTLSDGIDTVTQPISLTVNEVNVTPFPDNQSITTTVGTPVDITLSASDEDIPVQELSFLIVASSTSGTLSGVAPNLTYTPNPNFEGPDIFTFTASDGTATSEVGTISITVIMQATDVVEITRAEYNTRNGQLRVEATSTDPSAILSVLGLTMNNNGDGTYQLRQNGVPDPEDSIITVTSSLGGTATSPLDRK